MQKAQKPNSEAQPHLDTIHICLYLPKKKAVSWKYHTTSLFSCCWLVTQLCQLFATPWTVALQAPLFMGFSRQESWSGMPCPPPEDLPESGIKPTSPTLSRWVLYHWATRKALIYICLPLKQTFHVKDTFTIKLSSLNSPSPLLCGWI